MDNCSCVQNYCLEHMPEDLEKSTESTEPNEEGSNELKPGSNETYDDGYGAYGGWKPEGADDFFPGGIHSKSEDPDPNYPAKN